LFIKDSHISSIELKRLIAGCIEWDRTCQKAVYELYAPQMMLLCLRYAKNREEAEEVLQDGFIRTFRSIQQFKNSGSFGAWLRKIVLNSALQKYRGRYHGFQVIPLSDDLYRLPAEPATDDKLNEKELIRLIQSLPPAYRMVFNLYVFEGLKHREIAETLGISEGTSKSNLYDARTSLKRQLAQEMKIAR
jgi:RNA polymerase sigma factor (sigma-70 family)